MIKVDAINSNCAGVEIAGSREIVCLELMLVVTLLLKNNAMQEVDKKAIKNVLDLDPTSYEHLIEELTNTFNEL